MRARGQVVSDAECADVYFEAQLGIDLRGRGPFRLFLEPTFWSAGCEFISWFFCVVAIDLREYKRIWDNNKNAWREQLVTCSKYGSELKPVDSTFPHFPFLFSPTRFSSNALKFLPPNLHHLRSRVFDRYVDVPARPTGRGSSVGRAWRCQSHCWHRRRYVCPCLIILKFLIFPYCHSSMLAELTLSFI